MIKNKIIQSSWSKVWSPVLVENVSIWRCNRARTSALLSTRADVGSDYDKYDCENNIFNMIVKMKKKIVMIQHVMSCFNQCFPLHQGRCKICSKFWWAKENFKAALPIINYLSQLCNIGHIIHDCHEKSSQSLLTCHFRCCTSIPSRDHPAFGPRRTPRTLRCSSPIDGKIRT